MTSILEASLGSMPFTIFSCCQQTCFLTILSGLVMCFQFNSAKLFPRILFPISFQLGQGTKEVFMGD